MEPTVYSHRNDRLGARLKNLYFAWLFTETIGGRLIANWGADAKIIRSATDASSTVANNYRFFDLFDEAQFRSRFPNIEVTHLTETSFRDFWLTCDKQNTAEIAHIASGTLSTSAMAAFDRILFDATRQFEFADSLIINLSAGYFFGNAPVHKRIEKAILDVEARCDLSRTICVHLRRGDLLNLSSIAAHFAEHPENQRAEKRFLLSVQHFIMRYAPYHAYLALLHACSDIDHVMVMSDDAEVKARLENDVGDKCIHYDMILDSHELTQHQRDYAEFVLISRANRIVGTESAFVAFAAQIGAVEIESPYQFLDVSSYFDELNELFYLSRLPASATKQLLEAYATNFSRRSGLSAKADEFRQLALRYG